LIAGVRETEDQHYLPLSPIWLHQWLSLAAIESQGYQIKGEHMDTAIEEKYFRESYLPQRAIDDILDGQVIIETTGEQIGSQVTQFLMVSQLEFLVLSILVMVIFLTLNVKPSSVEIFTPRV